MSEDFPVANAKRLNAVTENPDGTYTLTAEYYEALCQSSNGWGQKTFDARCERDEAIDIATRATARMDTFRDQLLNTARDARAKAQLLEAIGLLLSSHTAMERPNVQSN